MACPSIACRLLIVMCCAMWIMWMGTPLSHSVCADASVVVGSSGWCFLELVLLMVIDHCGSIGCVIGVVVMFGFVADGNLFLYVEVTSW